MMDNYMVFLFLLGALKYLRFRSWDYLGGYLNHQQFFLPHDIPMFFPYHIPIISLKSVY